MAKIGKTGTGDTGGGGVGSLGKVCCDLDPVIFLLTPSLLCPFLDWTEEVTG